MSMEKLDVHEICPKCLLPGMKTWDQLTDEEQFLALRLPASAEFTPEERRRHHFCPRCWHETLINPETRA